MRHLREFMVNEKKESSKSEKDCLDIAKKYGLDKKDKVKITDLNPSVGISIPKYVVLSASDYHEFEYYHDILKLIGLSYKFEELGCDFGGQYEALFYMGKKPVELIEALKFLNEIEN